MKRLLILFLILLSYLPAILHAQNDRFAIVFYNVENLFDTIDNPETKDEEFTPQGSKKWNTEKYNKKLQDLARVLSSVTPGSLPEIIGLAEIENLEVLTDLIKTPPLSKGNYGIIHENSPDARGIDVALLYRKDRFKYTSHKSIQVIFPFDSTLRTRDILYVSGKATDGKDIHFYVNHWSSRSGGEKQTETQRMFSAVALRRNMDILLTKDSKSRIVIMGDLNDEPTNQSLMNVLQASNKRKNILLSDLYNLFYDYHNLGKGGSYYYQGTWNMLDHIIISHNLLNQKDFYSCDYDSGKVLMEDWMLYEEKNGNKIPNRTYIGNKYTGGISDHLPVYLILSR